MQPAAPPPWLMFAIRFVGVSLFVGWLVLIKAARMGVRGLTDPSFQTQARSAVVRTVREAATAVQSRSPQRNAENTGVQGVQPFGAGSAANTQGDGSAVTSL